MLQRRDGGWGLEDLLTILVVEDDPLIQTIVKDALTDGGFSDSHCFVGWDGRGIA